MTDPVREFQTQHHDHLGKPLSVDGLVGPRTQWALDFRSVSIIRQGIVRRAQRHLGLTEDPPASNRDPDGLITDWLDDCNAIPGQPWCAAFASFCIGTVRIAGAQKLGLHFPDTRDPYPGDIVWYPVDSWKGHCGIVTGRSGDEVMTIEGNLDNAVRCARRKMAGIKFSRVHPDISGTCPIAVPSVPLVGGGERTR